MSETGEEKELPEGWEWTTFHEIGEWRGGGTPSKQNDGYWSDGTIPWVSPKDMKSDFIASSEDRITERAVAESTTKVIPEGSVLFVTRSGILRHTLPVAVSRIDATVNQDLKALTPSEVVMPEYLLRYVQAFNREILHTCSKDGTTVQSIEAAKLYDYPVPLAPPEEQRRIVDKIEELFSDLDAGVQALETARRQLDRYRQSVLKAAVEGALTAAWRARHSADAEPADALLTRILEERRARWEADYAAKYEAKGKKPPQGWKDRYKEPEPPDTTDLPDLPEGWVWANMDSLLADIQAGKSFKCEERPPEDDEVGLVKVSAVSWGEYQEHESKTCTDEKRINPDYFIEEGDFLFSRANTIELVGACVIVRASSKRLMLSDKILRFDLVKVSKEWILYILRSQHGRRQIESLATGNQHSMRNIGQKRIREICIPLPPLAEQEAIVEEVEQRLSIVDAVSAETNRQLGRADQLRRAILKHAFEGRLVAQQDDETGIRDSFEAKQLTLDV